MKSGETVKLRDDLTVHVKRLTLGQARDYLLASEAKLSNQQDNDLLNQLALDDMLLDDLLELTDLDQAALDDLQYEEAEKLAAVAKRLNPHFFRSRAPVMKSLRALMNKMDELALQNIGSKLNAPEKTSNGPDAPLPAAVTAALSGVTP